MITLAVDTSTQIASVALLTENSYEERLIDGHFSPSEDLLEEIGKLLERASIKMQDLELLAVTKGPGSFTGLRIAMSSLKGIASALSIPLVSVPTLSVITEAVGIYQGAILAVIDAKKKKFYLSMKKGGETIIEDRDGNAEDIISILMFCYKVGVKRSPQISHMHTARRARCITCTDLHIICPP